MIRIPFKDTQLVADVMPEGASARVLFLHGGGVAGDRHRFDELREACSARGIATAAFDFIGHGETGGDLKSTTLHERTDQALAVIQTLAMEEPISLVAGSMSGYTAIKLTESVAVERLVLIVPAVYRRDVYDVPFKDFTPLIREPGSWRDSDAWDLLAQFKGRLLMIVAGRDEVIPSGVIEGIQRTASAASSIEVVTVADAPHGIIKFFREHPSELERVQQKLTDFLL